MTFIASVVARKGVAIIADSLVTASRPVLDGEDFLAFLKSKAANGEPLASINVQATEIVQLFSPTASYTKDYEEKLFKMDKFSAITTAGAAAINDKRIEEHVKEIIRQLKPGATFEDKVNNFCALLNIQAVEHVKKQERITTTVLIFTHFDKESSQTTIFKAEVIPCQLTMIDPDTHNCIGLTKMDDYYKVVCDGQNRISDKILWGEVEFFHEITPKIVEKVIADLGCQNVPANYVQEFIDKSRSEILTKQFYDDLKISELGNLSLQQAVDLAALLMAIEMNIQKYTENIPTVGGVIKLATIDRRGFKWVSGNNIHEPKTIH